MIAFEILQLLLQRNCAWPNIEEHFYAQSKESNTKPELKNIANALKNAFLKELEIIAIWDNAKLSDDLKIVFYACLTFRQIYEDQSQGKENGLENSIIDSFFQEIEEKAYYLFYKLMSLFKIAHNKGILCQLTTKLAEQIANHPQALNTKIPHSALSAHLQQHLSTLKKQEYTLVRLFFGILIKADSSKIFTLNHSTVPASTYHLTKFFLGSYDDGSNQGMRYITSEYSFGRELNARLQKYNENKQEYVFVTIELKNLLLSIFKKENEPHSYPWIRTLAEAAIMNDRIMKYESDSEVEIIERPKATILSNDREDDNSDEDRVSISSESFFSGEKQQATLKVKNPTITV